MRKSSIIEYEYSSLGQLLFPIKLFLRTIFPGKKNKLFGFISGIPVHLEINGKKLVLAEINFLCVHKQLRTKKLAPVLIKEVTRRVNLCNIWQAIYTAGIVIPTPVSAATYWHRSLNPKKLVDVGFS